MCSAFQILEGPQDSILLSLSRHEAGLRPERVICMDSVFARIGKVKIGGVQTVKAPGETDSGCV